tara:strand:+ start:704 stop:1402 length:699 start_codon:yes stop_codon:yes gene_type:complete
MSSKLETLLKKKLNIKTENIEEIKLKTVKDYINNNKNENDIFDNDIYLGYLQLDNNNGVIVLKGPQGPPGENGINAICPARPDTSYLDKASRKLFDEIDKHNKSRPNSSFATPNLPFPGFSDNPRINEDQIREELYDNFGRTKNIFGLGGKKTKKSNKSNKSKKTKTNKSKKTKNKKSKKTKKIKKIKGGAISPLPKNPAPSSYYPAPTNPLPKPTCKLPHFRPYLLNQKGI